MSNLLHQVQEGLGGQQVLGFQGCRAHRLCLEVRDFPVMRGEEEEEEEEDNRIKGNPSHDSSQQDSQ